MSDSVPSDDDVFKHFHDVKIDHDNIAHYRGLMAKKLLINRCDDCATWIYPHRPLCPHCLSWNVTPSQVSGKGSLYMYTVIMQSRDPDNPLPEPMLAAAIELAEQKGLRYLSRVVDCPVGALAHDMDVQLTWIEEKGRFWPAFAPAEKHGTANG
jgi:uncharacterized protein